MEPQRGQEKDVPGAENGFMRVRPGPSGEVGRLAVQEDIDTGAGRAGRECEMLDVRGREEHHALRPSDLGVDVGHDVVMQPHVDGTGDAKDGAEEILRDKRQGFGKDEIGSEGG